MLQIPEVNHGNNWHEKWGESWDGKGGATKWTDRWAERYADGTQGNRKWGEKWNQRFGACPLAVGTLTWRAQWPDTLTLVQRWSAGYEGGGSEGGGKSGEEWTQHENEEPVRAWGLTNATGSVRCSCVEGIVGVGDGWQYSRTWGEVTIGEGNVRKFGQSTSGEHWDVVHHEDSWYEKYPHYGFDEVRAGPQRCAASHTLVVAPVRTTLLLTLPTCQEAGASLL